MMLVLGDGASPRVQSDGSWVLLPPSFISGYIGIGLSHVGVV